MFFLFFLLSLIFFFFSLNFMINEYSLIMEMDLLNLTSSSIVMSILLDWMSLLFMSFVLFISSMVIYYSKEYMEKDKNLNRFILLIVMFVFSMMLLIISPNLISILLGWDGLGLVSYCLVIYYQNNKSNTAGMLTALSNRIGDVFLLMAISWMFNYGSWNYYYYLEFMKNDWIMKNILYLVVLASLTKSAQIPFSSWLPAAMAAPTPVSSLVHSSTLVTAGVYLLIRFNLCFNNSVMFILLFISSMTMFMAGLGANFEFDLKKIIALSTLSQLGLMMSIISLMEYKLAFFHLLTHALFKATLFMCAGNMIHMMNNYQDIRYMGSLIYKMPLTCTLFSISNLSLCGLPFMSGFYSKDMILDILSMCYLNIYIYLIFFISTGLTVSYTFRLMYYLMAGNFNFISLNMIKDSSFYMMKSMMLLIFMIMIGGSMLMWLMFPSPYFICLPLLMKMMTLIVSLLGGMMGIELSLFSLNYELNLTKLFKMNLFFSSMWNMPILSTFGVNYYISYYSKKYYENLDQGWFEYLGSQNLFYSIFKYSYNVQFLYKNKLKIYLMLMIFWIIFLIFML
uniref:NADH-ubiquinone oxidoreductase chain 5 n=1 Tax=Tychobythinus sp. 1 EF-2015 TaxID=1756873 RepID=A0A0S2M978_9COLE|nr:NADH deshydrogenase subunit 5 [Tychobythinus sp. 1 EF-2015]